MSDSVVVQGAAIILIVLGFAGVLTCGIEWLLRPPRVSIGSERTYPSRLRMLLSRKAREDAVVYEMLDLSDRMPSSRPMELAPWATEEGDKEPRDDE